MAVGAVALGLGAAIGLLIPETRQENQWMGEARDRVLHKAQETVQDVGLKAQIVAEEAIGAAKQEAEGPRLGSGSRAHSVGAMREKGRRQSGAPSPFLTNPMPAVAILL